jgi:hypothetical protein
MNSKDCKSDGAGTMSSVAATNYSNHKSYQSCSYLFNVVA